MTVVKPTVENAAVSSFQGVGMSAPTGEDRQELHKDIDGAHSGERQTMA